MILNFVRPGLKARTLFFGTVMYVYFIMTKTKFAKKSDVCKVHCQSHLQVYTNFRNTINSFNLGNYWYIVCTPFHILKAVFQ